jgi:hypothetical protein
MKLYIDSLYIYWIAHWQIGKNRSLIKENTTKNAQKEDDSMEREGEIEKEGDRKERERKIDMERKGYII